MQRRILLAFAIVATLAGCATPVPTATKEAIAPTGVLRIAVYPGSPTSLVADVAPDQMRGVSVDMGRALAQRLGVPARVQVYPRVAEVVAAIQRGDADFTISNATAERARLVDFGSPIVDLELGYLAPAGSRVGSVETVDAAGVTVGVSQGSSSERTLGAQFKAARLRAFPNIDAARDALMKREIDAFATNKAVLFELADRVPGSRVLPGRWGVEQLAPALPKGRAAAGMDYLKSFAAEVRRNGEMEKAAQRAGLRGTAAH